MACGPAEIFCQLKGTLEAFRNEDLGGRGEKAFDAIANRLKVNLHRRDDGNLFNRRAFLYDSTVKNENDWVPGDAGYIDNITITDKMDGARTGENVIYLGQGQFWGHGQGEKTWSDMKSTVDEWSPKLNDISVHDRRSGPKIGLRKKP